MTTLLPTPPTSALPAPAPAIPRATQDSARESAESAAVRWIYGVGAFLLAFGWFVMLHVLWTPAHDGVDQNGYLVGGRMLAEHLTTGMTPPDLFGFVGRMWIETPWSTYYPKYPIGLPALYAAMLWLGKTTLGRAIVYWFASLRWELFSIGLFIGLRSILEFLPVRRLRAWRSVGVLAVVSAATLAALRIKVGPLGQLPVDGPTVGVELAYLICPVGMFLGLLATYKLGRLLMGSFASMMAMLVVACSPVTMELTNNVNSHGASLAFVTWGMFLLFRWYKAGGAWRAVLAGFLLGYAVTIRYSEGMLLLPIVIAILLRRPWTGWRKLLESCLLIGWWAIPVLGLVAFNLGAMGTLTGYDTTNESTGFSLVYFTYNWHVTVTGLYSSGLFFIVPFSLIGLVMLFIVRRWRPALLVASWVVPSLIVYTAYYWAPDGTQTGYLRFYVTIFPPLAICAFWLMTWIAEALGRSRVRRGGRIAVVSAAVLFALLSVGVLGWSVTALRYEREHTEYQPTARLRTTVARSLTTDELQAENASNKLVLMDSVRLGLSKCRWVLGVAAILAAIYYAAGRVAGSWTILGAAAPAARVALGAGFLGLASAGMGLYFAAPDLESLFGRALMQSVTANMLVQDVGAPAGSVVFADPSMLHHLQFVGDYQMYSIAQFTPREIDNLDPAKIDPNQPSVLQFERAATLFRQLHSYSQTDLIAEADRITDGALRDNHPVYLVLHAQQVRQLCNAFFPGAKYTTTVAAIWSNSLNPWVSPRDFWHGPLGTFRGMGNKKGRRALSNVKTGPLTQDDDTSWVIVRVDQGPPAP